MKLKTFISIVVLCTGMPVLAATGITNTKHNLSTSGTGSNHLTTGTDQICVFCHTPHGSDTTAPVPLWNRKLPAGGGFTTYATLGTSTLDGEVLAVGSVSLACLSCHDGAQAMDTMINAPGSGGYNAAGAVPAGWVWAGANLITGVAKLGTDMRDDHPIGVEYCGGGVTGSGATVGGACTDGDFIGPGAFGTTSDGRTAELKTSLSNGMQMFWVDVDGLASKSKNDIQLYTRTFAGSISRPSVECGSCHDPHVESKGSDNIQFMRVTTAGSKVCLSCHVK
jgi:predicted CXXCH cytochrome family protein